MVTLIHKLFLCYLQYFSHTNGFCTRSTLSISAWVYIVFMKNCSTSLNSDEDVSNLTRVYCVHGGIEDQWLGMKDVGAFSSVFLLTAKSPQALWKKVLLSYLNQDEYKCIQGFKVFFVFSTTVFYVNLQYIGLPSCESTSQNPLVLSSYFTFNSRRGIALKSPLIANKCELRLKLHRLNALKSGYIRIANVKRVRELI